MKRAKEFTRRNHSYFWGNDNGMSLNYPGQDELSFRFNFSGRNEGLRSVEAAACWLWLLCWTGGGETLVPFTQTLTCLFLPESAAFFCFFFFLASWPHFNTSNFNRRYPLNGPQLPKAIQAELVQVIPSRAFYDCKGLGGRCSKNIFRSVQVTVPCVPPHRLWLQVHFRNANKVSCKLCLTRPCARRLAQKCLSRWSEFKGPELEFCCGGIINCWCSTSD